MDGLSYPCVHFPDQARGKTFTFHQNNYKLDFATRMATLYTLSRALAKTEKELGIRFILLNETLLGQTLTSRILPWDDLIRVSISLTDAQELKRFIVSLLYIGKSKNGIRFFYDYETDLMWYIDENPHHQVEYRLYSGCKTTNTTKLMLIETYNLCPRTYVDILVLYPASREEIISKLRLTNAKMTVKHISNQVLFSKALDIAVSDESMHQVAQDAFIFNYETVYPLRKCSFNGVYLSCPAQVEDALSAEYGITFRSFTMEDLARDINGCWVQSKYLTRESKNLEVENGRVKATSQYAFENYTAAPIVQYHYNRTKETSYPCVDFPIHAHDLSFDEHQKLANLTFEIKMNTLYNLSRALVELEEKLDISFILLHGTLIGQVLSKRVLPWDDDMDVSVSLDSSRKLNRYIRSLEYIGTSGYKRFYLNVATDLLWYIDDHSEHHIEYRLYSGCNSRNATKLMLVEAKSTCARTYVDVTVLYPSTRGAILPKLAVATQAHHPQNLSEIVLYYRALDIAARAIYLRAVAGGAHVYNYDTLYPLRKCLFNGVFMSCPAKSTDALTQEYTHNVLRPSYNGLYLNKDGCWVRDESEMLESEMFSTMPVEVAPQSTFPHVNTNEVSYPCHELSFQDGLAFKPHRKFINLTFDVRMTNLYHLSRWLVKMEQKLKISFILLHETLIGQSMSTRILPWMDTLEVFISVDDSRELDSYIKSLHHIGTTNESVGFFIDNRTNLVWHVDKNVDHQIEYRLYSSCDKQDVEILMSITENSLCPRTYVDIGVLYPSTRMAILPKLNVSLTTNRPKLLSSILFYSKALDIVVRASDNTFVAKHAFVYNYETLYPLQKCLFNGVYLSCPAKIDDALLQEYGSDILKPSYYDLSLNSLGCWVSLDHNQT